MWSFLLLSILSSEQAASVPAPIASGEVVVTGRRYRNEYERCLKSSCPPEREVEAALNASVEDFREGHYDAARGLLQRTIGRNRKYSARMPERMSDLYSTYADLSLHDGYVRDYRSNTYESVDVLRKNLGKTAPATLIARPWIGDMLVREGRPQAADDVYRDAAKDAQAAGQKSLAASIEVRRAWLAVQMGSDRRAGEMLEELAKTSAGEPGITNLVRAIRVRMAIRRKDDATVDRLIAEWRAAPTKKLVLLSEPPAPIVGAQQTSLVALGTVRSEADHYSWVDIGYWVKPSGLVTDAEVLRPDGAAGWAKPIVAQIAGRRYAPLDEPAGSPGLYRIERVSMRTAFDFVTGSHIAQRSGPTQLIHVDITELDKKVSGTDTR